MSNTSGTNWGEEDYCPDCRRTTIVVIDYSNGDVVCTECALVIEEKMAETTQEWRSFADEEDGGGRCRVGAPVNPLLEGCSLTTKIASTAPSGQRTGPLPPLPPPPPLQCSGAVARVADAVEKGSAGALASVSSAISYMCDSLGLFDTAKNRALDVYKKLEGSKIFARKNNRNTLLAACLFVACRLENCPRTLNEIMLVARDSTKKKLGQDVKFIEQLLSNTGYKDGTEALTTPADFMARFCSHLCLDIGFVISAKEVMVNLEKLDIRRTPASLAAGIIYMMTLLSSERPLRDIAMASQVSESTIWKTYKDLYRHASFLIPSSFATKEELSKLPKP